jgi:hypothetical protein
MEFILNVCKLGIDIYWNNMNYVIEIRQAVFNVDSKIKFNKNHSSSFRDKICDEAAYIYRAWIAQSV